MDGKKPLVLVADDDSSMREVVSEHLQSVGYRVLVAEEVGRAEEEELGRAAGGDRV